MGRSTAKDPLLGKTEMAVKSKSAAGAAVLTKLAKQRPPGGEFTGGREERAEATTMALKAAQEPRLGFSPMQ